MRAANPGTPQVTYGYYLAGDGDTAGTLRSVSSTASTTTYAHDKFGRVHELGALSVEWLTEQAASATGRSEML